MSDSPHLFEADNVRIANEAKVRTALEQPDFAEREFQKWQAEKDLSLRAESFATAWAKVAWLAEGRMHMMGRELDKLQKRIARQRKANRGVLDRLEESLKENEKLKKEIRQKALDEMARLTQEIEEPSEVNRLWRENKELRQRIDELEKG